MRKKITILTLLFCSFVTGLFANTPQYDICIYGESASGVIAAIQGARMGKKVVLISKNDHVGGLVTSGLTATDMNRNDLIGGITKEFYNKIYNYYLQPEVWHNQDRESFMVSTLKRTYRGKNDERQIQWVYESSVAERIMRDMLKTAGVEILFNHRLDLNKNVRKEENIIRSIQLENGKVIEAKMFIDASYEGDLLARTAIQVDIMQDDLARIIAKVYILKDNISLQFTVVCAAIGVHTLPGPQVGALLGFGHRIIRQAFGVDQHDLALVHFRLFVQQVKDTLAAGQSHDDGVELHGDLADGHVQGAVEGQKAGQLAQGQACHARQSQRTADHGAEHIGKVAQLGVSRTAEVGVTVGLIRAFKQLVIELIKLLNGFFLVAEHLHDLLAVHHLFNVAVHRTNITLLGNKVLGRVGGKILGDQQHNPDQSS